MTPTASSHSVGSHSVGSAVVGSSVVGSAVAIVGSAVGKVVFDGEGASEGATVGASEGATVGASVLPGVENTTSCLLFSGW